MPTLNYYLNALGRCGTAFREGQLQGTDIGANDFPYLFRICRQPGLSQDALARALYVHKCKVTRCVTRLEAAGYLTRTQDPADKRALLLHPTQKALDALPMLRALNAAWHDTLTEGFTPEEAEQFRDLLERALHNARARVEEGES